MYRRYRPETFGEMIGQAQVTDPLMTALRSDRVGHAYLFSGPRGCGKTTSARILARCLNCAQGPTDTPCGTCDSCVELSRGGGGSLDVVEIDAASHNGVDDARDLRERAIFAPARDRFKIFILDEAHMVTAQGFNALLKLVEEPPEHVKFIFATTEPEKVIGTIRSRTHHYPFRLVAPGPMLEYVEQLCVAEGVQVEPGVLPLVVRAGGGSPRDTLSLLDQLIAGSDPSTDSTQAVVRYERAVALLGYTHAELLDEVVDAFGARDAAAAFSAVDRVVQTGQDPRRFVDDLLERLRDLIIVAATGEGASAVLRGIPADELERMGAQASVFGTDRLSRIADLVVATLDEMTGATSPRLQLELMVARVLAATDAGAAAPIAGAPAAVAPGAVAPGVPATPVPRAPQPAPAAGAPAAADPGPGRPASSAAPVSTAPPAPSVSPSPSAPAAAAPTGAAGTAATSGPASSASVPPEPPRADVAAGPGAAAPPSTPAAPAVPSGPITLPQMRDAWPEILNRLEPVSRTSWMIASAARPVAYSDGDVLTLSFQSQADVAGFKKLNAGKGPSEDLRGAIQSVLGVRVKYMARHDAEPAPSAAGSHRGGPGGGDQPADPRAEEPSSGPSSAPAAGPDSDPATDRGAAAPPAASAPAPDAGPRPGARPMPDPGSASDAGPTPDPDSASDVGPTPDPGSASDAGPTPDPGPMPDPGPAPSSRPGPASGRPAPASGPRPAPAVAAPVTEWAVAAIPTDDPTGPQAAQFAVDDEPEEAASTPLRTLTAQREGDILTVPEPGPYDDDDAPPPPEDIDAPVPPRAPVVVERPVAPNTPARPARGPGIERVGEAVVRQMLGATFIREEPYTPPTRFN
nr:DNA polymerase III subunit gamma and tau [Microbacterium invictum]